MEKSSKELLKYILDLCMEFSTIQETFERKSFLPLTKIRVDINADPVNLISNAFDITDNQKEKKIFYIINEMYNRKFTTQEAINKIENILKK